MSNLSTQTDGAPVTMTCAVRGYVAPGAMCGHIIVSNKTLCGYKGNEFCEHQRKGCHECGASTQQEAETKCKCSGDKDHCHGCDVWPD